MKGAHADVGDAPCRKSGYVGRKRWGVSPNHRFYYILFRTGFSLSGMKTLRCYTVPKGRLNLAQDASPGLDLQARPVPQGRLEIGLDEILENFQPSLRDSDWK